MNLQTYQIDTTSSSTVLRVKDENRMQIAMKVQTPSHHLAHQQDLKNEYNILKFLRHENIVEVGKYYENLPFEQYDSQPGVRGFEMELAQEDLLSFLQKNRQKKKFLNPIQARSIFSGIAKALQYIHACEIIHNDIKLENILLFQNGDAKLADFGFACESNQPFQPDIWKYRAVSTLAPEMIKDIIKGNTNLTTDMKKSDSFAFGVTLFESLFLIYPFKDRMASEDDMYYSSISRGNYESFWDLPTIKKLTSMYQRDFLPSDVRLAQLKDLLNKLLTSDSSQRLSFDEILAHPWMQIHIDLSDEELSP